MMLKSAIILATVAMSSVWGLPQDATGPVASDSPTVSLIPLPTVRPTGDVGGTGSLPTSTSSFDFSIPALPSFTSIASASSSRASSSSLSSNSNSTTGTTPVSSTSSSISSTTTATTSTSAANKVTLGGVTMVAGAVAVAFLF